MPGRRTGRGRPIPLRTPAAIFPVRFSTPGSVRSGSDVTPWRFPTQAAEDEFNRLANQLNREEEEDREQARLIERAKRPVGDLLGTETKDRDLRARKAEYQKKWAHLDGE